MSEARQAGLLVLHGNRLELLAEGVFAWLASNPLDPLEQETFLVQSNGMAEWLKMELAAAHGVCASTTMELPARFVWRAYRAVLGPDAVPQASPLDKLPLTWRLMRLLPALADEPVFAPVAGFLGGGDGDDGDGDAARRLQLAQRLADLFDQYQVHRGDWLDDWSRGADVLRAGPQGPAGAAPLPDDQCWQPALWRALLSTLAPEERAASRAALHRRFIEALRKPPAAGARAFPRLPRRVVLFGTTHIPHQTLEAVAALAAHCQVLMAVPNPCRYHWADIIDGREALRFERRRHALRRERDLAAVPLQDMHAHGHPLLAAWGRQSRDFVRQLDAFDDVQAARQRFTIPRVDLFDEAPGGTLLQQVQAAVRDLLPLAEHPRQGAPADDRSIVFHVAHSAQREVEILHDQLLHLLAHPPAGQALAPRDIVVMVPDIDAFAPAIRSVFGQHPRSDARHIPWGIADQKDRGRQPLMVALEWLLRASQERFGVSQVRDLLEVPALAARLGVGADDLALLAQWIEGAGVRWGLDAAQRASLGLSAAGEQNSWAFGLRRMLLGYAAGELAAAEGYAGIEPYAEVAGLEAGLAGALAELLRSLATWWADAAAARTPAAWAGRLRRLIDELFRASDDDERALLAALGDALAAWLQACESAGFDDPVELAVAREAWLGGVDEPRVSRRFKAGGVTFCTLLPLRAIPFEVVCLLGMNDGDYPRRGQRIDFDLMALPGCARPGDRSRRDDDRQLMLDALLSARRVLYVSWAGRSQRDNQLQPPSVLVAQLRDYLAAGFGPQVPAQRTTEHPLQPFSRRYFEPAAAGGPAALFTYAAEWRAAHGEAQAAAPLRARTSQATPAASAASTAPEAPEAPEAQATQATQAAHAAPEAEASTAAPVAAAPDSAGMIITVKGLADFLRNPVREFFRSRLQVRFDELEAVDEDDEPFVGQGLERWGWVNEVLGECSAALDERRTATVPPDELQRVLRRQVDRLARAGRLPIAGPGRLIQDELLRLLLPVLAAWRSALSDLPFAHDRLRLHWVHPQDEGLVLDDWLPQLRAAGPGARPVWIELQASRLTPKAAGKKKAAAPPPRQDKLVLPWVRALASAACGCPARGIVIGEGALVQVEPPPADAARAVLAELMSACRDGLLGDEPLPTALQTGCAYLDDPAKAAAAYEPGFKGWGEGGEASLARLFPDFASLAAQPSFAAVSRRLYAPYLEWLSSHATVQVLDTESIAPESAHD